MAGAPLLSERYTTLSSISTDRYVGQLCHFYASFLDIPSDKTNTAGPKPCATDCVVYTKPSSNASVLGRRITNDHPSRRGEACLALLPLPPKPTQTGRRGRPPLPALLVYHQSLGYTTQTHRRAGSEADDPRCQPLRWRTPMP